MKATLIAVGLIAAAVHGEHAFLHDRRHVRQPKNPDTTIDCTVYTSIWYGEPSLVQDHVLSETAYNAPTSHPTDGSSSSESLPTQSNNHVLPFTSNVVQVLEDTSAQSYTVTSTSTLSDSQSTTTSGSSIIPQSTAVSNSSIITNGDQWGISYTPYDSDGNCKTSTVMQSDIEQISNKGFTTVRLYSTDCSVLENVGQACIDYGMKMILGIFIDADGIDGSRTQVDDIIAWGTDESSHWGLVSMIVIGNEAVFNGYCTVSDLVNYITECKEEFANAGYDGPCTTSETLNILEDNYTEICAVVDVVACNLQPFFNSEVSSSDAGQFVKAQLEIIADLCPALEAYNLECGWPKSGNSNGLATPGEADQSDAIDSLREQVGNRTVMFSYEDEKWKDLGVYNVEQSWGCIDLF